MACYNSAPPRRIHETRTANRAPNNTMQRSPRQLNDTPRNRCRVTSRRVYTLQADPVRIPRAPGGIGRGNRPVPIPADSAENRPVPGADAGIVRTLSTKYYLTQKLNLQ